MSLPPPQPLTVATDWGAAGAAPLGISLAVVAIGAFFYWRALRRTRALSLRAIAGVCAGALAVAWFAPVLFSSDVYAYAAYGEMARAGLNPYAHPPVGAAQVAIRAAQEQWMSAFPICVYGSAFVELARAVMTFFAPLGLLAQLDAFRAIACLALLICTTLAYGVFPGDRAERARASSTIGLNPVAIWCAAEGHNDSIALAIVLAGFALVRRGFAGTGAAVAALSALIKSPGAAAALALGVVNSRARVGSAVGIVIAAACSIPLLTGVATQLAPHGRYAPEASLQAALAPLGAAAALVLATSIAFTLAAQGIALLRQGAVEGWIWLGLGAWLLVPNPYPWYAIWLTALAALSPRSRAGKAAILFSFASLLRYIPDVVGTPNAALSVALGVVAALPLLVLTGRDRNLYRLR